jgi:metal-responsive CopG/Arc/MetJ family transcriptional regulator
MRTTLTLHDDVAAAVEQLRRERGIGPSEAVNELIRRGLAHERPHEPYVHVSADVGLRVDVSDIGEVLEMLDEPPR